MVHNYTAKIIWTGNKEKGTTNYRSYERSHDIRINNKETIKASSDPAFMGDNTKHNPEELFLASLSSCHMLWYLHLCANEGIIVIAYSDTSQGIMTDDEKGGRFTEVTLYPEVTISNPEKKERALELHHEANKKCFIANSCNFPVNHLAVCKTV